MLHPRARICTWCRPCESARRSRSFRLDRPDVRVLSDRNADDEFATKDLEEWLKERGVAVGRANAAIIRLERVSNERAKKLFDKPEEGYAIAPASARELVISAETDAGIFYGAQTVKQLIRGSGKDAVLLLPTIRDWPAMAHRGLSDDWSRGPLPNMEFREARNPHAGGLQVQHLLALLRTHLCLLPARRWPHFRAAR